MTKLQYVGLYLLFLGSCSSVYSDWETKWQMLCPALYPHVFTSYAPRGNLSVGIYTRQTHLTDIKHCVAACCSQQQCHVAMIYNMTCFHIQCTSSKVCLPLYRPNLANMNPPRMVLVKPVDEEEAWNDFIDQDSDVPG